MQSIPSICCYGEYQDELMFMYRHKPDADVDNISAVRVYDVDKLGISGVQVHFRLGTLEVGLGRIQAYNQRDSKPSGQNAATRFRLSVLEAELSLVQTCHQAGNLVSKSVRQEFV